MFGLIVIPIVFLVFYLLFRYKNALKIEPPPPPPPIDPSAPGVHYYEECDYKGEHKHTDQETSITDSFKSVRVVDDFDVKAFSVNDVEVFLRGPTTIKCTPFKGMEITRD